ncbi:MAG TPA: PQQ-binding-like beta-propeller repeat protein [Candidatus Binatia bacterium]|nr:PQQ-binding-like beta-propeller repeat protein [Candidatus Binatia bacterium]
MHAMIRRCAAATAALLSLSGPTSALDWPMFGRDLEHSFSNPGSGIDRSNVALLQEVWSFPTADAVTASPAVVDGVVYVGSWDGAFYALDAATGAVKWSFPVDCQETVQPIPARCPGGPSAPADRVETDGGLITSSAAVVDGKVYFAGGKTVYCLNAGDGSLVWKRVVCGNPEAPDCENDAQDPTRVFASPAVSRNRVIVGHTTDGDRAEDMLYRGGIVALDARTGRLRWRFEVDPVLDANGKPVRVRGKIVGRNRSCGPVWSSAAIDQKRGLAFLGTGDCGFDAPPPYHEAILALRVTTGRLRWAYRPRQGDTCDFDFGASANLIDVGSERWVGVGGKDGTYYVLNRVARNPGGELVWRSNVVFGGFAGGFVASTAFDGTRVYGGTAFGELGNPDGACDPNDPRDTPFQQPTMHAFDPVARTVAWQQDGAPALGASSVANGVVFVGTPAPPSLRAFDAVTGSPLAAFPMAGAVNSSAALVGDALFVGSGNSNDGSGGGVHALRAP